MDTSKHPGRPDGQFVQEEAMDRDALETLCQSFAARQTGRGPADADPVPEILRSFRLAEISAAEMQSLMGLVSDDDGATDPEVIPGFEASLDAPPAIVDDFPDFDEIVAAGIVEDDEEWTAPVAGDDSAIIVRIAPFLRGAAVEGRGSPQG